jgi:hypothetical protein
MGYLFLIVGGFAWFGSEESVNSFEVSMKLPTIDLGLATDGAIAFCRAAKIKLYR